jgi:pimeloyl-ACP methyl ester carboxylesterase
MTDDALDPPLAGCGTRWIGAAALRGGKGYVNAPLGQLHYRDSGAGAGADAGADAGAGVPLLLIHQTPVGLAEFVDVQAALARHGRRSIAPDNPGFGGSDPVLGAVTVAALADNLVPLLDHLQLPRVIVAGHHSGAALAAAFAARHPGRTAGVVLHGAPLYTEAERAERLARPAVDAQLQPDGSHFGDRFRGVRAHAGTRPEALAGITWAVIGQFLAGPQSATYRAVFANDMAADIAAIRAPTLVLSDSGDVLHRMDRKVVALRPDFSYVEFSDEGSFALMSHPQRWADLVAQFAATQVD